MEFINMINKLNKTDKNIKIYLDMDGTIVENIFDLNRSFEKKGGYIKKRPIKPIVEQINTIIENYKNIEVIVLSCSSNDDMIEEKNEWIDINIPNIKKENRVFLSREKGEYTKENMHEVKGKYIKNEISSNDIAILIDDNNSVLKEFQKMVGHQAIPVHVTTLLL